jgi:hypothetical protein
MGIDAILESVQYVIDKDGQQTAVLLDLPTWDALRHLLEDLGEDERLGELLAEVQDDETFEGDAAWATYQSYLSDPKS